MNDVNKEKWREEFEALDTEKLHPYSGGKFSKHTDGQYDHTHMHASWLGYLVARERTQDESLSGDEAQRELIRELEEESIVQKEKIQRLEKEINQWKEVFERQCDDVKNLEKENADLKAKNSELKPSN